MKVLFEVFRQQANAAPRLQSYSLEVDPQQTVLDCLNRIKWELDGSLAFRKNCRNTICGSCAMRINGSSALACREKISRYINGEAQPRITIAPMGNFPVIKDLIVDMQRFWDNLEAVDPYVSTKGRAIPQRESLQTPEQRSRLEATGNCILCGACYSECNAKTVNPDFVGPHALAKAQRLVADSRDGATEERVEQYDGLAGVWGCTRCYWCNEVCPMGVAPMDRIGEIKQEILVRKDADASRAIRHRKALVDLVASGGWIDERKFGLLVVGNRFRDLRGLLSLIPLGWQMLRRGKFPLEFKASPGTGQVRSLIAAVRQENQKKS